MALWNRRRRQEESDSNGDADDGKKKAAWKRPASELVETAVQLHSPTNADAADSARQILRSSSSD